MKGISCVGWHLLAVFVGGLLFCVSSHAAGPRPAGSGEARIARLLHLGRNLRSCPRPVAHGQARCNARVLLGNNDALLAMTSPAGLTPADLRNAYEIQGTGNRGTIIALVEAYRYPSAEKDLAVYRAQFGLPPCTSANGCFRTINQNGGSHLPLRRNLGWNQEAALDLDMASAMCPNCSLLLVEARSPRLGDLATAANTAASIAGVHVVSNSYGGSETGTQTVEPLYDHPGVAVVASTGDSGYGVQFPAASPHVIAVGGTSLRRDDSARGWSETAWSGGGSGCSQLYFKPAWQLDTACARRTVGDVAAVADPATGVAVYGPTGLFRRAWMVFGGTSVAAPLIGGIFGERSNTVGDASGLYARPDAFFDIVSGSNGSCGGSLLCTALPGYDGPTGLGTPMGDAAF